MNAPKHIWRSVGAVLAGIQPGVILALGTDMLLRSAGIFPPFGQPMSDALFLLAFVYRTIYGLMGSYLTARLAPNRPMAHALVLGILGFAVSFVGVLVTWDKGTGLGPKWYPIALAVTAIPVAWAGGRIREMQLRSVLK